MRTKTDIVEFLKKGGNGIVLDEDWSGKVSKTTLQTFTSVYDLLEPVTVEFAVGACRIQNEWGVELSLMREKTNLRIEMLNHNIAIEFRGEEYWKKENPSNILDIVKTFNMTHGDKFVDQNSQVIVDGAR